MLCIVLAILMIAAVLPIGVDGRWQENAALVFLKLGLLRLQLFPWKQKEQADGQNRAKQQKKPKKQKKRRRAAKPQPALTRSDYLSLAKLLLRTLQRFRRRLSVDLLQLHYTAASGDPYDTVMQYSRFCATLEAGFPLAKQVLHIKKQDIILNLSFETEQPIVNARLELTLRVWELCWISLRMLVELLRWRKQRQTAAAHRIPAAEKQAEQPCSQTAAPE